MSQPINSDVAIFLNNYQTNPINYIYWNTSWIIEVSGDYLLRIINLLITKYNIINNNFSQITDGNAGVISYHLLAHIKLFTADYVNQLNQSNQKMSIEGYKHMIIMTQYESYPLGYRQRHMSSIYEVLFSLIDHVVDYSQQVKLVNQYFPKSIEISKSREYTTALSHPEFEIMANEFYSIPNACWMLSPGYTIHTLQIIKQ